MKWPYATKPERRTLLWVILAIICLGLLLHAVYKRETVQQITVSQAQVQASYESIVTGYAEFADVAKDWMLKDAHTKSLIEAIFADATPKVRGQLYRHLYPFYESLRTKHVRQLHFVGTDGRSRLRMHAPELYGDQLFPIRPLLREVADTGRPVSSFENGRIFSGFRYIYPVTDGGHLLGIMEISLSFTAIRRLLEASVPANTHIRFLLQREAVLQAMYNGQDRAGTLALFNSMYIKSPLHPGFVTEDFDHPLYGEPAEAVAPVTQALEILLGKDAKVSNNMDQGIAFGHFACPKWYQCELINFLPVSTQGGKVVAYVMAHSRCTGNNGRVLLLGGTFIVGSGFIAALITLGMNWLRSHEQMRIINEHVGKGIYVVDRQGIIVYANPAAETILGFHAKDMAGKKAHDLIHAESEGKSVEQDHCPIMQVALHGNTFQGASELFRCRNGLLVPVEVTASPILQMGEVTGVVTLFSDIRDRLAVEARLRQRDAAFNQAAEGLLITDKSNQIVAVNRSFTRLTGYLEAEVIGKTPAILSSGQHPPEFYQRMWAEIQQTGQWQGEIINRRKNGSVYPEWLSIAAIYDNQGDLTNYVAVFNDISEIKEKEARLDFMAHHDNLTGLPNRTLLTDRLNQALKNAARNREHLAVLFMDLDRFKHVNDSLGHNAGDQLLAFAAERIADCLRKQDTLARQGGDEFVILIENLIDGHDAAQVAEKVILSLRPAFHVQGHEIYIGGSIGISMYPEDGDDVVSLLKHADSAMYLAKEAGGNTYRYFNQSLAEDALERLKLETELHRALERNEFELYYQPKVSLQDATIQSWEALLRWHHPVRGLLGPGCFLKVANNSGMMVDIGVWVMHAAAQQLATWRTNGVEAVVSVNIDGSQLSRDLLMKLVTDVLERHRIEPWQLGLEITETAIMEQPASIIEKLSEIRALGLSLYIDDFGTGHSSLARLKQLPISVLKVDAAFVRNMVDDSSDRAIVCATVAIAHEMSLRVVAEGVEHVTQLELLREIGCDGVQGYLIAMPMKAEQAEAFMRQGSDWAASSPFASRIAQGHIGVGGKRQ